MTPTTYGRDFAYCLKSHGGVRGFNASLWRFLLRCTLFCLSVATFLTSVSSYEGGCGFEAYIYGSNIGEEARYRNKNVLLGPGVNIYRSPLNGRNFEYMGEDPFGASRMVVPYIKGVQKNGVAVCVKHYALNIMTMRNTNGWWNRENFEL